MISKPLLIGGLVGVGVLALLATSGGSASASEGGGGPALPPGDGPHRVDPLPAPTVLTPTADPGVWTSNDSGMPLHTPGYQGPGHYEVLAPSGLYLRDAPSKASGKIISTRLSHGQIATVYAEPVNGWSVASDGHVDGYICGFNCSDAPDGPWLALIVGQEGAPPQNLGPGDAQSQAEADAAAAELASYG